MVTDTHRDLIGGLVERFVVDSVRKYDGSLGAKFPEISASAQFIENLEDHIADADDLAVLQAAIKKMRDHKIRTIRDIMTTSMARLAERCDFTLDEADIVTASLFGALRAHRRLMERRMNVGEIEVAARCSRCDGLGKTTIYIYAGTEYTEREVRVMFPDVSLFDLAGRDDVDVVRRACGHQKIAPVL